MGKKASKATRKFASSGQLKKVIQARHKHQQIRKKTQGKRAGKDSKDKSEPSKHDENREEEGIAAEKRKSKKTKKGMSVDELLDAGFMNASDDSDDEENVEDIAGETSDDGEEEEVSDDGASFASVDDLEDDDGEAHLMELSQLAEKDPEFYQYLQQNDQELLEFDPNGLEREESEGDDEEDEADDDDDHVDVNMEQEKLPTLTIAHLRKWQKAMLERRSLRALRKLLIAFRAGAHLNEDNQVLAWSIDSSSVYNKLVTTALKYTPVVLDHHVPYKTLTNGKLKPPTQTPKFKTLQKLILSYFHNIIHILTQLTDNELLQLAVTESAKLVPYIVSSRKAVKLYLKKCLDLWSSAEDRVRIAAFLAIRKLANVTDESIMDNVLKGTYLTLIRSSKSTTVYTLPSINLMKNSASEVFCVDHSVAYQHAFGYIRQLAIHLRNSMKVKTKEAYKQVYNWQYVHCIDFWSIVLARACDARAEAENGGTESDLKPLIYPLVQVCLGAIKLISTSRSYPFHLHIIRSLLHLTKHSEIYIPLSPYLVPILTSTLTLSSRPRPSTLRFLDLEVYIRAPQQYLKTRIYYDGIIEETAYLLAEWLTSPAVHGSIAFPEIVVPIVVLLRKAVKSGKSGSGPGTSSAKDQSLIKVLLERIEESSRWIEQRRKGVTFTPGGLDEVQGWEKDIREKVEDSPLAKYVRVQRKSREKRRKLVGKAQEGEVELLDE